MLRSLHAVRNRSKLKKNRLGLANSSYHIVLLHENIDDYWKAYLYYEHAVDLMYRSLSANHPHLQMYRWDLSR